MITGEGFHTGVITFWGKTAVASKRRPNHHFKGKALDTSQPSQPRNALTALPHKGRYGAIYEANGVLASKGIFHV